ncbi:hypothetical protein [Clostridium estertheticum]|uniref:hypothetical protein n=1 Tax=Clostridium estertheticum TaxID=238834 RepID=UPI001CF1DBE3|nr:hypothetical protein [Clostridium estertheticum]MCB2354356.1 hypothetical protein [Clostridium estertheticum]WAG42525.1 hypothetical protein LL065_07585 [Clostridium estertheticum]
MNINETKLDLQAIEDELNKSYDYTEEGYWTYKLALNKNTIVMNIFDGDEIEENYGIEINEEKEGIKSLLQDIINFIYENEINHRQNYVNKSKSYYSRKIKSMALWMGREKTEKVNAINIDLVERYNTTTKLKNELDYFKGFTSDFYNALTELCPTWKIEDICEYIDAQFRIYDMHVGIDINEDSTITVYYLDSKFTIIVNNFSKRNIIFSDLYEKFNNVKIREVN